MTHYMHMTTTEIKKNNGLKGLGNSFFQGQIRNTVQNIMPGKTLIISHYFKDKFVKCCLLFVPS